MVVRKEKFDFIATQHSVIADVDIKRHRGYRQMIRRLHCRVTEVTL